MAIDRVNAVLIGRGKDRDGFECDVLEDPLTGQQLLAYTPEVHWQKAELAKLRAAPELPQSSSERLARPTPEGVTIMAISPDIVQALAEFRKVKIAMPECDTLKDGRELVTVIQMSCDFPLCYVQRLGKDPAVMVWRVRDTAHAMEDYRVRTHQA